MHTLTWLPITLLVIIGGYKTYQFFRCDYLKKQYERYRLWVGDALDIARTVNFGKQLASYEIRDKIMLARIVQGSAAYVRPVWLSFLERDLHILIDLGIIEKVDLIRTTPGGHTYHEDVYHFTALGVEQYRHFHSNHVSEK